MSNSWEILKLIQSLDKGASIKRDMRLTTVLTLSVAPPPVLKIGTRMIGLDSAVYIECHLTDGFHNKLANMPLICIVSNDEAGKIWSLNDSTYDDSGDYHFTWVSHDIGDLTFRALFVGDEKYAMGLSNEETAECRKWAKLTLEVLPNTVEAGDVVFLKGFLTDYRDGYALVGKTVYWQSWVNMMVPTYCCGIEEPKHAEDVMVGWGYATPTSNNGWYFAADKRNNLSDLGVYKYQAYFLGDKTHHYIDSNWAQATWKTRTTLTIESRPAFPPRGAIVGVGGALIPQVGPPLQNKHIHVYTKHLDSTDWIELRAYPEGPVMTDSEGKYGITVVTIDPDSETTRGRGDDLIYDTAWYKAKYDGDDAHFGSESTAQNVTPYEY